MIVKWKMNRSDTANYTYEILSQSKNDLDEVIECQSDLADPNLLALTTPTGVFEPECFTYLAADSSLEVYAWEKQVCVK